MKKILVLEDDLDIGEMVEMVLSIQYNVMVKRDDENLLTHLSQFGPDLLLIDNSLGRAKAVDVIKIIKSHEMFSQMPFILFSGHPDLKLIASELGASAYLPKPFGLEQLHRCIEKVLDNNS